MIYRFRIDSNGPILFHFWHTDIDILIKSAVQWRGDLRMLISSSYLACTRFTHMIMWTGPDTVVGQSKGTASNTTY